MGNAASSAQNSPLPQRQQPIPSRTHSPANPSRTHSVHRSLRTKKRSLELPDLASLSLTPASSHLPSPDPYYRRAKPSSPIPIPHNANGAINTGGGRQLPSTTDLPVQPSTHIPIHPPSRRHSAAVSRHPSNYAPPPPPIVNEEPFVQETVRSTLPIGLSLDPSTKQQTVDVRITWNGGGKSVLLARAGDANWKGRRVMEKESADTFSTHVSLLPGTHHIKFIVDDVWRVADDLPTAVDDDGSLANYVDVAPSSHMTTQLGPSLSQVHHQVSFWSASSDAGGTNSSGPWTSTIPSELIAAAREEEAYLTEGATGSAPHIPPAPILPRHLDRLILNARPIAQRTEREGRERERDGRRSGRDRDKDRGDRDSRDRERDGEKRSRTRQALGMTEQDVLPEEDGHKGVTRIVGVSGPVPALADDGSVLPVPSHVVLHHLSTSAIRNGVLAVGNTTRYRKKFITTVYYKPT
ncbi:5'-AMP-activated protein kinase beta subunit, interation domain-containing protein [Amylostereum chailletii]|nr:5'-AMP-activated protein kinase beta subunit, interation domain-containing protein [Amylostereum chailletii]